MELQNQLKQMAAKAALEYVVEGEYLGVGTGTTVGFFITELATSGKKVKGCVSSSEATTRQLLAYGIPVCDLNDIVDYLPVYIDGCDEIDGNFCMITAIGMTSKGRGKAPSCFTTLLSSAIQTNFSDA